MIYNKPMQTEFASDGDAHHNPVVLCSDIDERQLYTHTHVSRRKVKKEMRRIRKGARRVSFFKIVLSTLFSLFVMAGVLYFSNNGVFTPDYIKEVASQVLSDAAVSVKKLAEKGSRKIALQVFGKVEKQSIPVYLSPAPLDKATESIQKVVSASGYMPLENMAEKTENENNGLLDVSVQTGGKSGTDGKVYLPLVSRNLSSDNMLLLSNETKLSPDMPILSEKIPKAYEDIVFSDKPLVLILHTHGTECYTSGKDGKYEKNEQTRSDNTDENVVAVGRQLAQTLRNFGIPVIHSETLHDKASFLNAYTSSLNQAHKILSENPSIRFVIDLHRDAIVSSDGEKTAPTAVIAGEEYAQLMFVIGTNEAGFNHPDWEDNLCFAVDMQKSLDETYPNLMRPINLRSVSFNEQLSSGYVLLETGACGNTLEQAKRSAEAFGTVLARKILQNATYDG